MVGGGKLGGILLRAYLRQGLFAAKNVSASVKHAEKAAMLSKELGIAATTDNKKAVHGADIVLLGVKPQVVGEVLKEIASELGPDTLIISVAASVPTSYIEKYAGDKVPVVRAMPNTPATVGCGDDGHLPRGACRKRALGHDASDVRRCGPNRRRRRKKYGCGHRTQRKRAGVG